MFSSCSQRRVLFALLVSTLASPLMPAEAAPELATASTEWEDCTAADAQMNVDNVELTPDAISRGDTLKFVITGNSDVVVPGGSLKVAVAYHGWHVFSKTGSLCHSTPCPIQQGPFKMTLESHLPSVTPPGPYTITITATSSEDKQVGLCVKVPFRVGGKAQS